MNVFTSVREVRAQRGRTTTRRVLVPTMGALHAGHVALIRRAREIAGDGEVAVSIFVNPLQFEPGSDFAKYPRPDERDEAICKNEGVDVLFRPGEGEMYFSDRSVAIEERALSQHLCGRSRPGHFRGVCTVVTKLFHILAPDVAIFGEKDFQQLAIIRRLVRDLDFLVEIVAVPTVREADGLALSSRNQYLDSAARAQVPVIRRALSEAAERFRNGEVDPVSRARATIQEAPLARIDYLELVDAENLEPLAAARPHSLLAAAVFFGQTRLIDNILLT